MRRKPDRRFLVGLSGCAGEAEARSRAFTRLDLRRSEATIAGPQTSVTLGDDNLHANGQEV